jgi:hypothetical protein
MLVSKVYFFDKKYNQNVLISMELIKYLIGKSKYSFIISRLNES